jgi:hypothetical protein
MAQKVITIYTDDLTGKEAEDVQTVAFGLDGKSYEIDLTAENHDKLVELLNPYILAGRKTGKPKASSPGSKSRQVHPDTAKIREWAKEQGYEVNDRGRVPANIREAYDKAN